MAKKNPKNSELSSSERPSEKSSLQTHEKLEKFGAFTSPLPVVIGNGWAALASVGFLVSSGSKVIWIQGTGSHAYPPLPTLESGKPANAWRILFEKLGLPLDEPQEGFFLREFRHKSFMRPVWLKSATPETRVQALEESMWLPETRFIPILETHFGKTTAEMEDSLRLLLNHNPNICVISGFPVTGFEPSHESEPFRVILGSGEKIPAMRVIYGDRWSSAVGMKGLQKSSQLTRNKEPVGILQAVFNHSKCLQNSELESSYFGVAHKDSGEDFTRSVFGYFMDGGKKSIWTILLSEEEGEDNHAIAKKLRRLKQTLERMFNTPEWLPEGVTDFFQTVSDEQVCYEESFLFGKGSAHLEPVHLGKKNDSSSEIQFVTDAYGPSVALTQVLALLGEEAGVPMAMTTSEEAPLVAETA